VLEVEGLEKSFAGSEGRVAAVAGVSFTVEEGRLFSLLGPSGCGKTTVLRCIAGLERPDAGRIVLDGRVVFAAGGISVPTNRRGLGMVFQSYAIWPHLSVFGNVSFPLAALPRRRRPSRREIEARVGRVLAAVRLEGLAGRPATDLSGGQQQRLALARALVTEPPLLLLDEPLSSLDLQLREEMRLELKRLQRELRITTVYVTHDQVEALALSNVVAVMQEGRLEQVGRPREVYDRPATGFVAAFVGASNLVRGAVESGADDGTLVVRTPLGRVRARAGDRPGVGEPVVVVLRPEGLTVEPTDEDGEWVGTVVTRAFLGSGVDHVVAFGETELRARGPAAVSIRPGTRVRVRLGPDPCAIVEADGL
jgi:iron(III) transport system ATP-binding protein